MSSRTDATPASRTDATPASRTDATPASRTDATPASRTDATPTSRTDATPASRTDATPASRTDATGPQPQAGGVIRELLRAARSGAAFRPEALRSLFLFGVGVTLATANWWQLSPLRWLQILLVAIIANAVVVIIAGVAWRLWLSRRDTHSIAALLLFAMALGTLQLFLRRWGYDALAIDSPMAPAERTLSGALQGIVWLISASGFYEGRAQFLHERAELLATRVAIELRDRRQSALTDLITRELVDTVGARLAASVSDTRSLLTRALTLDDSAAALQRISSSLRGAIDDDIRPMSRELWSGEREDRQAGTWQLMLRIGCYTTPYPVTLIGLLMAAAMVPTFLVLRDFTTAAIIGGLQIAVLLSILSFADEYLRRRNGSDPWDYWAWVLITPITAVLPWTLLPRLDYPRYELLGWLLFSVIGVPAIIVTAGMLAGVAGTRESILERVRASIGFADVGSAASREQLREASRRLARHLHSSLQGRLMAISLELEHAAQQGDSEQAGDALRRLDALLEASLVEAMTDADVDVSVALRDVVAEWAAIVEVQLQLAPPATTPVAAGVIVGVVEEAVANAVRHGGATRVHISVIADEGDCVVRVWNDGDGVDPERRGRGLGSRWLDSVSRDRWSLRALDGGTLLEVRVPNA